MPAGHDGPHALTRRPRTMDRRWEGDARPVTASTPQPDDRHHYESHTWDDESCIVCGVSWTDCDDVCPSTPPEPPTATQETCVSVGDGARAHVTADAPPQLLSALDSLADAARREFGSTPPADAPEQQDDERHEFCCGEGEQFVQQAEALLSEHVDTDNDEAADAAASMLTALLPLVLAYGDARAARASRRPAEADQHEQLAALFLEHQRPGISPCKCGGMRLGESYPHHLADVVLSLLSAPAGPADQDDAQ